MNEIQIIATIGGTRVHGRDILAEESAVEQMAINIMNTFDRAEVDAMKAGSRWYRIAWNIAADMGRRYGVSGEQAAAVIAILSPRCSWEVNIARAEAWLGEGSTVGLFTWQVERLREMLADMDGSWVEYVRGPKVSRFYRNIVGDTSAVTVDIWASRVALGWVGANDNTYKQMVGTPLRYELVERAYRAAANRLGVAPSTVQAVTWVQVRDYEAGNVGDSTQLDAPDNLIGG